MKIVRSRSIATACMLWLWLRPLAAERIKEDEVDRFVTLPDISPPKLKVHYSNPALLASGYIFISPWYTTRSDTGPHIYDTEGRLVWSGTLSLHGGLVSDFHVCNYGSHQSLCFFEGRRKEGWGQGQAVVLDSQYRPVTTVRGDSVSGLADMHEFNLMDDGRRALISSYSVEPYDGTRLNFTGGLAWLLNSHFKDVDVASGKIMFEWNALDHIVPAPQPAGLSPPGTSRLSPLDFFHLNSIAKSMDGDYIISARHTNAIYKISHQDGHIVWQLGGQDTHFAADFQFCHQHHAQIISEAPGKMIVSIFDNGCNDGEQVRSAAKTMELDTLHMTAILIGEYGAEANVAVKTQGSTQVLPSNGNVLVGWGSRSKVTEYTSDGALIFNATITGMAYTYRVYKSDWHAVPAENPKIFGYARTEETRTVLYVSWNGATEVTHWRFFGRNSEADPFTVLGTATKKGFETTFISEQHVKFSFAEAISSDGQSLRNSSFQETFIPSVELASYCTDMLCPWQSERTAEYPQALPRYYPSMTESIVLHRRQLWTYSCALTVIAVAYVVRKPFRTGVANVRRRFQSKSTPIALLG